MHLSTQNYPDTPHMGSLAGLIDALRARARPPFHDFGFDGWLDRARIRHGLAQVMRMRDLHEHARYVGAFEAEFGAAHQGVHALGVASGTDALYLALKQAGVGPGHEVITCPNTWITTLTTVFELGARCRFVDIDPATGLMNPAHIAAAIGPATAAILPIHMYGSMVPMPAVMDTAHAAGVPVIEDACQAIGALCDGRPAGSWGDAGCFSFHATKLVGAPGDGGLLVTPHQAWLDAFRRDAVAQWDEALLVTQARVPSRLAALHVPFLRTRLRRLETRIAGRAKQWHRYHQGLQNLNEGRLLGHAPSVTPAYRNCILITPHRRAIAEECRRSGIPVETIYPASEAFVKRLSDQGCTLPHALELASFNLSLPLGRQMNDRTIDRLINIVRRHH